MKILRRIDTIVTPAVKTMIALLLFMMLIIGLMQVLTRYVFSFSFTWSEELLRLCMLWAAFLSASLGVREKKHIGLEMVVQKFTESFRMKFEIFLNIIVATLLCIFWFLALKLTIFMSDMVSPILQISKLVWYLSVLSGFTLMVFYYLRIIVDSISEVRNCSKYKGR
jgi:TRAP-type C4-dicarboxylate transport system permease small subunit